MSLARFKQSTLYRNYLRTFVWNWVMPPLRAPIKAHWLYRNLRNEPLFIELAEQDRARLAEARLKNEQCYLDGEEPLISVTIATYNRGRLLVERTLPSVLCQTYQNFEIVVVGDHCADDTSRLIAEIKDPRIRFHNLPERPWYPDDKKERWRIAGVEAITPAHDISLVVILIVHSSARVVRHIKAVWP